MKTITVVEHCDCGTCSPIQHVVNFDFSNTDLGDAISQRFFAKYPGLSSIRFFDDDDDEGSNLVSQQMGLGAGHMASSIKDILDAIYTTCSVCAMDDTTNYKCSGCSYVHDGCLGTYYPDDIPPTFVSAALAYIASAQCQAAQSSECTNDGCTNYGRMGSTDVCGFGDCYNCSQTGNESCFN